MQRDLWTIIRDKRNRAFLRWLAAGLAVVLTGFGNSVLSFASPDSRGATNPSRSSFSVRNYGGKCLDYGPPWQRIGPTVYLNDCAVAHPVVVQEINDRHQVILNAGNQIIGVRRRVVVHSAGPEEAGPEEAAAATEYPLELFDTGLAIPVGYYIFDLDGDSVILANSRPCISTDANLCPPPPPELVVQVQNARGANGSPLVVGPRNLADSEFWDFNANDGSRKDPTSGFIHVATNYALWNTVCASPKVKIGVDPPKIDDPMQPDDNTPLRPNAPDVGCSQFNVGWGSVIVVTSPNDCGSVPGPAPGQSQDIGGCIDLSYYPPIALPAGVTVRGNRWGTNFGPQLYYSDRSPRNFHDLCSSCIFDVKGDYVRVNGLRLRGESRSTDLSAPATRAIEVDYPGPDASPPIFGVATITEYIAMIDHNDISDWGEAAVDLSTPYSFTPGDPGACTFYGNVDDSSKQIYYPCGCSVPGPLGVLVPITDDHATLANVRVARNFLHHNERDNGGYGVAVGRAFIEGNTFLMNRHDISASGEPHNEYRAWYNLVLSNAPLYGSFPHHYHNQDFDMHGTNNNGHWFGGRGGFYVDILGNAFLATNRENYELRGVPCNDTDFHSNVALEDTHDAVHYKDTRFPITWDGSHINISSTPNQFGLPDPIARLGVGDFDGDGDQDLFLATGTAWYYSPGGAAEWRFLSAKTDKIDTLLFGDFDGDGRTDVVAKNGDHLMVSWGGVSGWEQLSPNSVSAPVSDLAVGRFLDHPAGDRRDDIFLADGTTWFLSSGGSGPFHPVNTSGKRVSELRFGDFDGDGKTDVFGVVLFGPNDWRWAFSKSAQGAWADGVLQPALTNKVDNLVVADFDGDGRADIATNSNSDWMFSYGGVGNWTHHQISGTAQCSSPKSPLTLMPGIGRFQGNKAADVLLWDGVESNGLCIAPRGVVGLQRWTRQDMR
jgi:hypothetical protein